LVKRTPRRVPNGDTRDYRRTYSTESQGESRPRFIRSDEDLVLERTSVERTIAARPRVCVNAAALRVNARE